ncbi:hypothetical protein LWI28_002921 [Acer negundo]|uniref:BHLH domain-containing protein n=1 Tax=Acer negundo TaxID=4023 RepID=A0AAD5IX73_ACENE|nr:hypothetical protein LWI28_002921 [Acer negundo]KAK4847876.1 hypothetical protein QYF36_006771 [Acer negundo]
MADNGGGFDHEEEGDHEQPSFSQLLFSDDDAVLGLDLDYHHQHQHQTFNNNNNNKTFSSSSDSCFSGHGKPPKMLCFGDYNNQSSDGELVVFGETTTATTTATYSKSTPQKSGVTACSDSSSASSGNNSIAIANTPSKYNKKRSGSGKESVQCSNSITTTPAENQRTSKKTKADNTSSTGHAKPRKEKLGERISTLQQLVSPFGKTDTASVLHEAMGYIRFLQEQVQVLCSPYLQQHHNLPDGGGEDGGEEGKNDLRSRGLCLVPVACTVHVAESNGADFWSPAMVNNASSSLQVLAKQQ